MGHYTKQTMIKSILKEPLLYFFLIASVLFYMDHKREKEKSQIIVDEKTITYLVKEREKLQLRPLSPSEKKALIEDHINNDLLYREAQIRGLDNDSRIKRQMIQKMDILLTSEVPEPSERELKAYFDRHKARYTKTEARDLEQVFFSPTSTPPEGFLERLSSNETEARKEGDSSIFFGDQLNHIRARELLVLLGKKAAQSILLIDDDRWHGPIVSRLGTHFIRLSKLYPEETADFDDVKAYLSQDYTIDAHKAQLAIEIDKLRAKHDIVIQWPDE